MQPALQTKRPMEGHYEIWKRMNDIVHSNFAERIMGIDRKCILSAAKPYIVTCARLFSSCLMIVLPTIWLLLSLTRPHNVRSRRSQSS